MQPEPNYRACVDPGDITQLTDGKTVAVTEQNVGPWVKKEMVGWAKKRDPIMITLDLESDQAISGFGFHTAAGGGGVVWPAQIAVFTGVDGKEWHYEGDLRVMSASASSAPSDGGGFGGAVMHLFSTRDLKTHGRYVRFVIVGSTYVFSDEVEVYAGNSGAVASHSSRPVLKGDADIRNFVEGRQTRAGYESRIVSDRNALEEEIANSPLSVREKANLQAQLLEGYKKAMAVELPSDSEFRAVMPMNEGHAQMLATRGELWGRKLGAKTVISKRHRYEWVDYGNQPERPAEPAVTVEMLKNEFRGDMFLLSNPSGEARTVKIQATGITGDQGWLRLFSVPWTDTLERKLVATALEEVKLPEKGITLPAGMSLKVWLAIDSSKLSAGGHSGGLVISDATGTQSVPFQIQVSKIAMPRPPVSLQMWDYVCPPRSYGMTEANFESSVKLMKEYFVNKAWGHHRVYPKVSAANFGEDNQLKTALDFSTMDRWMLKLWPDAEGYFLYLAIDKKHPSFAGAAIDSPAFEPRIASWLKAITAHMETIGVDPHKLAICPIDEPGPEEQFKVSAAWNKALKKADPRVVVFIDPANVGISKVDTHGALEAADIICPNTFAYGNGTAADRKVYSDLQANGKRIEFYFRTGPTREVDPTLFYRLHGWYAQTRGAKGIGYWAFADIGGHETSWNDYSAKYVCYSPVFLDPKTVTPTIHLEALREGVEDYTLLTMLKEQSEKNPSAAASAQAKKILETARWLMTSEKITGTGYDQLKRGMWFQSDSSKTPDVLRLKAIHCLEELELPPAGS